MKTFAALEMTPEGAALWNDFQGTWTDWRQSNDEFFRMAVLMPKSSNRAFPPLYRTPVITSTMHWTLSPLHVPPRLISRGRSRRGKTPSSAATTPTTLPSTPPNWSPTINGYTQTSNR